MAQADAECGRLGDCPEKRLWESYRRVRDAVWSARTPQEVEDYVALLREAVGRQFQEEVERQAQQGPLATVLDPSLRRMAAEVALESKALGEELPALEQLWEVALREGRQDAAADVLREFKIRAFQSGWAFVRSRMLVVYGLGKTMKDPVGAAVDSLIDTVNRPKWRDANRRREKLAALEALVRSPPVQIIAGSPA
ncbi:MAG TPA: hypothetical protein VMB51_16600 [Solirubrobacteraceae bacterium]|nr:hypothetical protein [Solirubrobacteraceae bacterium]